MKAAAHVKKVAMWYKQILSFLRNPKISGLLTIGIITVALPVTIIALNSNTDSRQHAAGPNCVCQSPGQRQSGKNGFRCADGHISFCAANVPCYNNFYTGEAQCGTSSVQCQAPIPFGWADGNNIMYCNNGTSSTYCSSDYYAYNDLGGNAQCKSKNSDQHISICQFPGNPNWHMNQYEGWTTQTCGPLGIGCDREPHEKFCGNNQPCYNTSTGPVCGHTCQQDGGTCSGSITSSSRGSTFSCPSGTTHFVAQDGHTDDPNCQLFSTNGVCCVPPASTSPKYSCSNNQCVEDDTNGTFTDYSSCTSQCGNSNPSQCTVDKSYNECESGNSDACTDKYGDSIKGHLTHVTHDTCGNWTCDDVAPTCDNSNTTPTPTPNPAPIGNLDTAVCKTNGVAGWSCDASDFSKPVKVELYEDGPAGTGTIVATISADTQREQAVAAQCGGKANHGFTYTLPKSLYDGNQHTLYADGIDIPDGTNNTDLSNSGISFTCIDPHAPTTGNITVQFEGIGQDGNTNPHHRIRQLILYFYQATDTSFHLKPYISPVGTVQYNATTGYFSNPTFPLTGLQPGKYLVLARSPEGSLVSQIGSGDGTGPITITAAGVNNMLVDTKTNQDANAATIIPLLNMGNIVAADTSFNTVDSLDYSALMDCYGSTETSLTTACLARGGMRDTTGVLLADLNDDGAVDGTDYTLLAKYYLHSGIGPTVDPDPHQTAKIASFSQITNTANISKQATVSPSPTPTP